MDKMKSICLFSSYYNGERIPYYVKYYLAELRKYFSEIVFITNEKKIAGDDIVWLKESNIQEMMIANDGYDFGMWYKAMKRYDITAYDQVGLINDSCILFKPLDSVFDWINTSHLDYCGMVSSRRRGFHLQSFFVVINKNAIRPVYDYFMETGIITDYTQVIIAYEVGLSAHLQRLNLSIGGMYYSKKNIEQHNPSFLIIEDLIIEGMPLIKKKIIFRSYRRAEYISLLRMRFNIDHRHYIELIERTNKNQPCIDFERALKDFSNANLFDIYLYKIVLRLYLIASKSQLLTFLFHQLILLRRHLKGNKDRNILITSEQEHTGNK